MKLGLTRSGDVDIAYNIEGQGNQVVLLIMGLGERSLDWGKRFPAMLAEYFTVVRIDNRGTGQSTYNGGGFSLEDMALDALSVLDAIGAPKAHVIGLSMGGMIAQLLALDHRERVDRLVLMATHAGGATVIGPTAEASALFSPAEFNRLGRSPEAMMRRTAEVITAPGFVARDPAAVDELAACARLQPTPPAVFLAQFQAIIQSDRLARLPEISRPTLVIHGMQDSLIPVQNGRMLAKQIPSAELLLLDDCGHFPMLEKPEAVCSAILQFLK